MNRLNHVSITIGGAVTSNQRVKLLSFAEKYRLAPAWGLKPIDERTIEDVISRRQSFFGCSVDSSTGLLASLENWLQEQCLPFDRFSGSRLLGYPHIAKHRPGQHIRIVYADDDGRPIVIPRVAQEIRDLLRNFDNPNTCEVAFQKLQSAIGGDIEAIPPLTAV